VTDRERDQLGMHSDHAHDERDDVPDDKQPGMVNTHAVTIRPAIPAHGGDAARRDRVAVRRSRSACAAVEMGIQLRG